MDCAFQQLVRSGRLRQRRDEIVTASQELSDVADTEYPVKRGDRLSGPAQTVYMQIETPRRTGDVAADRTGAHDANRFAIQHARMFAIPGLSGLLLTALLDPEFVGQKIPQCKFGHLRTENIFNPGQDKVSFAAID